MRGCMADDVLILIDQQKAMRHPKWGPRNNPGAEANIARLLEDWRRRGAPLVHVKHDSTQPDSPFAPGQEGNDFLPLTAPLPGETVVAKKVHSAFIGTELSAGLQAMAGGSKPALVICGVLLANSVEATVRVAANLGFRVKLPGDACWSCDKRDLTGRLWPAEDVHQLTLALLAGEYAEVTTTDEILEATGGGTR
jgi:nicotinamidase-related amidase